MPHCVILYGKPFLYSCKITEYKVLMDILTYTWVYRPNKEKLVLVLNQQIVYRNSRNHWAETWLIVVLDKVYIYRACRYL